MAGIVEKSTSLCVKIIKGSSANAVNQSINDSGDGHFLCGKNAKPF